MATTMDDSAMNRTNSGGDKEMSVYRKMMITPALKILNDPDHSEKSLIVLIGVMDRCCREEKKKDVFLGGEHDENDRKLAFAFAKWFLKRFSFIFTRKKLVKAFSSLIELKVKILNLFRDREPAQFSVLISTYFSMLRELVITSTKHFKGETGISEAMSLKVFDAEDPTELADNCVLKHESLYLGSLSECVLLQANLTKIIALASDGILQYNRRLCCQLSCILLDQLDFGGVDLFKPTLDCLGRVLCSDCPRRVFDVFLNLAHRLFALLIDPDKRSSASASSTLEASNIEWSEVEDALADCVRVLSDHYGTCSVSNHQYLRLLCLILQQPRFHRPASLENLLSALAKGLQKFPCPETTSTCRFNPDLWIQLLSGSQSAILPLVIITQSDVVTNGSDWPMEASEPSAKRLKMDFLPSSPSASLWDQLKHRWLDMLQGHSSFDLARATALVRIAIVGAKLKLKWREMNSVLDDADLLLLNGKLREILLQDGTKSNPDGWMLILCEYLENCIPLTYSNVDKNVTADWLAFSALPWLSAVSQSCDLDPRWLRLGQKFGPSLLKYQSSFARCFVKFPATFFKTWAIDVGLRILDMEFLQADAEAMIPSLPWIVRHGKTFREPLIQCLTNILASGASENITELTRNGALLVCALSGKMTAVNSPDEGLCLRCAHSAENPSSAVKVSTVSEDTALFFLQFVFDENEHSVLHRMDLFRSVLHHSAPSDNLRSSIVRKLNKMTENLQNRPVLQRAMLKCTTVLVQYWKEDIVADCFPIIFKLLLLDSESSPMVCWAKQAVSEIATRLNITPDVLYQRQVSVVCEALLSNSDLEWRVNFITLVPDVFGMPNQIQWLGVLLPNLIPRLVVEQSRGPSPFLEEVCALLNTNRNKLICDNFSSIYVYMLLHCDRELQASLASYVEGITHKHVYQLRSPNFQSVHNELLVQFHSQRERVLEALRMFAEDHNKTISRTASASSKVRPSKDLENLGDNLHPRFLGILVHFDGVLLSKCVSDKVKIEALSSLSDILQLIGSRNITAMRSKVLATLRTALQLTDDPFPRLNASAWDTFVRILGVKELGPLVSQIVVSVLPLYSSCAEQIRSILYYIVVENAEPLKDYLRDLHFLPELPGLDDIVYSLKNVCLAHTSIQEQLSLLMRNISHEDIDVRMQSLRHLKSIVQKNPDTIQQLIMGTNDTSEAVMTRLISGLLKGCPVREEELLLLYGKCFGFLGAIDPGRLSFSDYHRGEGSAFTATLIDDEFTFHLLELLARSFLAPRNSHTLTVLSFTIQQILKIYNSEDDPNKLFKSELWKRLPEQLCVAFTPLTSSRYILTKPQMESDPAPFPVYRSAVGKNYNSWLYNWTVALTTKVNHPLAKEIFTACLPTMKRDLQINLYLLPYVVITALWGGGPAEGPRIAEEMMAVLTDRGLIRSPRRMMKRYSSSASATDASSQDSAVKDSADVNLHQSSMQAIFYLLDHLKKWLKQKLNSLQSRPRGSVMKKETLTSATINPEYKVVQELVDSIPNDLLARASHQCKAYARAILHLETYLKTQPKELLQDQLGFLQKLYVAMDEPDGVAGVCAIRVQEPTLEENITAYEATGRLQDAFSCYERISQREDCSLEFYQGMLRCLLNLDLPQGALTMANGLLQNCPEWRRNLDDYRAECTWRLGQWDALEEVVQPYDTPAASAQVGWGVGLGQALLATKTGQLDNMENYLRAVRLSQMRVISAVNSYPRAYENIVKLHILSELESAMAVVDPSVVSKEDAFRSRFSQLLSNWNQRLDGVQASVRYMEPVLSVRRVVLKLIGQQLETKQPELASVVEEEIGKSWLVSARLARKADHFQRAHILQLVASTSPCPPPAIYVEQAKLHWAKGEQDQAITVLRRGLDKRFPPKHLAEMTETTRDLQPNEFTAELSEFLKAKLLLARYCELTGNADMTTIIKYYKEVTEVNRNWEEGYFRLAGYYDHLLGNIGEGGKEAHLDMVRYIVVNLNRSICMGSHFIYQAMPRMLSLWMELGTAEVENPKAFKSITTSSGKQIRFADITKAVETNQERIPPYKYLTAFPQLISRICHPHGDVAALLRRIIANVLKAHPQQCMWMMISVMKSSYSVRAKRCREIIDLAAGSRPDLRTFFLDATNLADRLVELANKPVEDGVTTISVEKYLKALPKLLSQPHFSKIMMPLQWMMSVTLPTAPGGRNQADHDPFPREPVYIVGVEDEVELMHSLQRPKKISFRGSDGKVYVFLCKPQDDLRKDFRLMEFNQLINRYLVRDPDARKRNLHIRTYGVIPLNEDCGLIEWIPNLMGLRPLLNRIYRDKNMLMSGAELKKKMPMLRDPLHRKRDLFEKELLPRFPAVFSEWFLTTFPDPQDWFSARLNYVRTTAVMSMVGFIVGLGDRHGENILFDSCCGDAVHVDFACLFNKGLSFEWPEQVPFRLTHNMIEAMGSTGIEGTYRKCCEVTLRILRKEMDTLLSVLKPFVHDPLVEWSKKSSNKGRTEMGEIKNELALEHVGNIELRLQGYLHTLNSKKVKVRLSVEGQVNQLIAEATSVDNLCQMYIGWAAYM